MSSQHPCDRDEMTDAELIREVYPRHTMKLLARLFNAPIDTARHWLYRNFSAVRRRELALRLLEELDQQDRRRIEVRRQLEAIVHEEHGEMGSADVGETLRKAGSAEDRSTTGGESGRG